jgi:hypothetical protein
MADHIKHRFRGSLQEWLQLLVGMQLISEEEASDAADRAAADAEEEEVEGL